MTNPTRIGARFDVFGTVQGVGFRPFVHGLAVELDLAGHVGNDTTRVFVEVSGSAAAVAAFAERLVADAPPLASVDRVERHVIPATAGREFSIVDSRVGVGGRTAVPPDTAVCDRCVAELFDPTDRRFRHPFITCTHCGPRLTIIRDLPYDRPNTTMADFPMCAACVREYDDPADRRHHAQPIGCHDCGPVLTYRAGTLQVARERAIVAAAEALAGGAVVAVKGLGGFHLCCDATDDQAVLRLRARKRRPDKPFAVLVATVDDADRLAWLDAVELAELQSPARPVVLARVRPDTGVSVHVAPDNPLIGLLLPHTPVHHLLLDEWDRSHRETGEQRRPLVMTSANLAGQPILHRSTDMAAVEGLCDGVLTHDRPVEMPCDDSVVRVVDGQSLPLRRARGFAPIPIPVPVGPSVFAVGADLKNTFCVSAGGRAWVGQHLGDMQDIETLRAFETTADLYLRLYDVTPDVVAGDAHPDYLSSRWADRTYPERRIDVQHHHAHIASVMAEHRLDPSVPVIGFAFDGTGYGDDGSIWGGEVLVADALDYERVLHLGTIAIPGGDAATRHPYRVALAHLRAAGVDWHVDLPPVAHCEPEMLALLDRQLASGISCVQTSSMGRLFDAVASILGLRHEISFEAQGAIDLEISGERGRREQRYRFEMSRTAFEPGPMIRSIVDDTIAGIPTEDIAWSFHAAVAGVIVDAARMIRDARGIGVVALSGGVFQNSLLVGLCTTRLRADGFDVRTHHRVPPNDGGLSLGQAFIASHQWSKR